MKQFNPSTDAYEIIELKRTINLAYIRVNGKNRYIAKNHLPIEHRKAYYNLARSETLDGQS